MPPTGWMVGSDHAGSALGRQVQAWLEARGETVEQADPPTDGPVDYPRVAAQVAQRVASGQPPRAVLCCGTGLGMAMAANRVPQVRAAACAHELAARLSREHNDANVLCLGERMVGLALAEAIVVAFASTEFAGGRHRARVAQMDAATQSPPAGRP